jgi:hypothetical protein
MVAQRGSAGLIAKYERGPSRGDTGKTFVIQSVMKQPTDQQERNEDKKQPEKENPSHGIDPESKEPEMETDQGPWGAAEGKPEPGEGRSAGGLVSPSRA